jgi:hypothetical protein
MKKKVYEEELSEALDEKLDELETSEEDPHDPYDPDMTIIEEAEEEE